MRVVPSQDVTHLPGLKDDVSRVFPTEEVSYLLADSSVFDHVLVCRLQSIDTSFGTLYGQCKRVHYNKAVANDLPLHQTHNFVWDTRASMYDLKFDFSVSKNF